MFSGSEEADVRDESDREVDAEGSDELVEDDDGEELAMNVCRREIRPTEG